MTESSSQPSPAEPVAAPTPGARRGFRPAALVLGTILGALAVVAGLLVNSYLSRSRTPLLTRAAYEAAAERWDERSPASYLLELELTGNRPGKIQVEVRDGQPVRMIRDGVEPKQQRTWYYWTVPGQMDMIAEELDMADDPAASFDSPQASQMIIRAEFDPEYGYPRQYDRVVLGTDFEIHWTVTRFEPLSPEKGGKK
jgi:hypothetical protein